MISQKEIAPPKILREIIGKVSPSEKVDFPKEERKERPLVVVSRFANDADPERNKRPVLVCGTGFNVEYEMQSMLRQIKTGKSSPKEAIKLVKEDVESNWREIAKPDSAYSKNIGTTEVNSKGENDLIISGVSMRDSSDNFIKVQKTDEGRAMAQFQKKQLIAVIDALCQLKDGQELYNFVPRGLKVEDGIALQRWIKQGNELPMEIQLLPRGTTMEQAKQILNHLTAGREDIQLNDNQSLLFRAVRGDAKNSFSLKTDLEPLVKDIVRQKPLTSVNQQVGLFHEVTHYESLISHKRDDLLRPYYYYQPKTETISPVLSLMFPWLNADKPAKKTGMTLNEVPVYKKNEPVKKEKPVEATSKDENNTKTSKEDSKRKDFRSGLIVVSPFETKQRKKETRNTKEKSSARKSTADFYQEDRKTKEASHKEQKSSETAREKRRLRYQPDSDKDRNDGLKTRFGLLAPKRKMRVLPGGLAVEKIELGEIRKSRQKKQGFSKDSFSRKPPLEETVVYRTTWKEKTKAEETRNSPTTKVTVVVYGEQTPKEANRQIKSVNQKRVSKEVPSSTSLIYKPERLKPVKVATKKSVIVKAVLSEQPFKKEPLSNTVVIKEVAKTINELPVTNRQSEITVDKKNKQLESKLSPELKMEQSVMSTLIIIPSVNQLDQVDKSILEVDKLKNDKRPLVDYQLNEERQNVDQVSLSSVDQNSRRESLEKELAKIKKALRVENKTVGYIPKLMVIPPLPLWFEVLPAHEPKAVKTLPSGKKFKVYSRLTRLVFNPEKPFLFHLSQSLRSVIKQLLNSQSNVFTRPVCLPDMVY